MSYLTQEEFQRHLDERNRMIEHVERIEIKVNVIDNRITKLETTLLNDYKHKLDTWRYVTFISSIIATLLGALLSKWL